MREKKIKHLPKKFGLKKGAENFPLMVVIEISNVCNSKCVHCVYTNQPELRNKVTNKFIDKNLFKKIADEIADNNSFLRITGTGEPFVHPDAMEMFTYALDKKIRMGIITNGSLLTPDKSKVLMDKGIEALEVSVDTHDKKTYESIRQGLKWDTMLNNIDFILDYRKKNNLDINVMVSIINQPKRVDVKASENFWKKKVDKVIVRKFLTWEFLDSENVTDPFIDVSGRVPCPHPFERIVVLSDGQTRFCNNDLKFGINMGDLNKLSIKEVWRGDKFTEYRNNLLNNDFEKNIMCKDCTNWKFRSWNYNYFNALKDAKNKSGQNE